MTASANSPGSPPSRVYYYPLSHYSVSHTSNLEGLSWVHFSWSFLLVIKGCNRIIHDSLYLYMAVLLGASYSYHQFLPDVSHICVVFGGCYSAAQSVRSIFEKPRCLTHTPQHTHTALRTSDMRWLHHQPSNNPFSIQKKIMSKVEIVAAE